MGSCISKCKPKRKPHQEKLNHFVQDKLVISQSSSLPPPLSPQKQKTLAPPSPCPSSLNSTSSLSSFSCSTQSTSCASSSSLSSASSLCSSSSLGFSKVDRTFSNEFLVSCAKENPQIIGLDPVKNRIMKQPVPVRVERSNSQKRARATSPNLTRQKSFRIEQERPNNHIVNGRNVTRSPSPSRRFNAYSSTTSNYQRPLALSTNTQTDQSNSRKRSVSYGPRKESLRSPSPKNNLMAKDRPGYLNNKERFGCEIGSKVEEVEIGGVLAKVNYSGPVPMEDIDNPHIALDCFIFL